MLLVFFIVVLMGASGSWLISPGSDRNLNCSYLSTTELYELEKSRVVSNPNETLRPSQSGYCSAGSGETCLKSTFGECCSIWGYCGSAAEYCSVEYCQPGVLGTCWQTSYFSTASSEPIAKTTTKENPLVTVPIAPPSSSITGLVVSHSGFCGGDSGQTCTGSSYGSCCSIHGWCGDTNDYCAAENCQSDFGTCFSASGWSESASSSASGSMSPEEALLYRASNKQTPFSSSRVNVGSSSPGGSSPGSSPGRSSSHSSPYGVRADGGSSAHGSYSHSHHSDSSSYPVRPDEHKASSALAYGMLASGRGSFSASFSSTGASVLRVSTSGRCGGSTGETCLGSSFGECCSNYGFCGSSKGPRSADFCSPGVCQAAYGSCPFGSTLAAGGSSRAVNAPSTSASSGASGTSQEGLVAGLKENFDKYFAPSSPGASSSGGSSSSKSSSGVASGTVAALVVSRDGRCGGKSGQTCAASSAGPCCSVYGHCGSTGEYCAIGACNNNFGLCGIQVAASAPSVVQSAASIAVAAPSSNQGLQPSVAGRCGTTFGQTCEGSAFGSCCSRYGFCGNSKDYCAVQNCISLYGSCWEGSTAPTSSSSSLA